MKIKRASKEHYSDNVLVEKQDLRPRVCVYNIEGAEREIKEYLYADASKRWHFLMSATGFGVKNGLIKAEVGRQFLVSNEFGQILALADPSKYRKLEKLSKKYGDRNFSLALARVINEKHFFTEPFLKAYRPQ